MITILVTGSRHSTDIELVRTFLTNYVEFAGNPPVTLIHGGAKGIDTLADKVAREKGWKVKIFHADWVGYGRRAGPIRNQEMVDEKPDVVIAFPGGYGTQNCIQLAKKAGLNVVEI